MFWDYFQPFSSALKAAGADFSSCDFDRRTPLHVAASQGDVDMVNYLMKVK